MSGKAQFGESNGNARLTEGQVTSIRRQLAKGVSKRSLSRTFGVSQAQILRIARKVNWR